MGPSSLARFIASEHIRDLHADARRGERARLAAAPRPGAPLRRKEGARERLRALAARLGRNAKARSGQGPPVPSPVTVRLAGPADVAPLARLAALDEAPRLAGEILLADANGRIAAALSLADGRAIADPFVRSEALVGLLRFRAGQLARAELQGGAARTRTRVRTQGRPA